MATATTVKPDALDATTPRHAVTLHNVDWEIYCQLRDNSANYHIRMAYLDGELTLMSPAIRHERRSEILGLLIRGFSSGFGIAVMGIRSTTAPSRGSRPDRGGRQGARQRVLPRRANEQRMR